MLRVDWLTGCGWLGAYSSSSVIGLISTFFGGSATVGRPLTKRSG